ncbi:MAG: hypothetical protein NT085_02855, partial [candidate division SR1 bacterium]|nr:hypothetical protein [candidate division SR1 bacterium]
STVISTAKHFGFDFKNFAYPEDFEAWIEAEPECVSSIKLIVLGQSFPGDGSKQRESGPSRGVLFYKRLLENNNLNKVQVMIIAEIENKNKYLDKFREYDVLLRDIPIDIMDYYEIYRQKLQDLSH